MSTSDGYASRPASGSDDQSRRDRYGRFSADGRSYLIHDYRTPRPWVNIMSNPRFGLAVSQTGSGFCWIDNSQLAVLTRWQQEFTHDAFGRYLYIRDAESGATWSVAPAPTFPQYQQFECRHGLGFTTFLSGCDDILAEWTLYADADRAIEHWKVKLRNTRSRACRLQVTPYIEWNCGTTPSPRREFHKLFIDTEYVSSAAAVVARGLMWDVPNRDHGHWNTTFPYVAAFGGTLPVQSAQGDKTEFFGRYGDVARPAALQAAEWRSLFGRHYDAVAALRSEITLKPGEEIQFSYALAVDNSRDATLALLKDGLREERGAGLKRVGAMWDGLLNSHRFETPDASLNAVGNDWVRYQAISARIWGRAGYYQQSGAYGFRDQLQDSQVWLTIDPARTRAQIKLHAEHQFADGSVYHWWHPLSEQGHITKMTDDLLWLSFVTINYLRETHDFAILAQESPFLDDATARPLHEHIRRAFERVFSRTSARGLPFIGAGDWNDGLSACGLKERGESIWLAHFLAGLLRDWAEVCRRASSAAGDARALLEKSGFTAALAADTAKAYGARHAKLVETINAHGWDGEWYWRATLDDGSKIGSAANRVGRIFLNAQTWAILNDIAPADRMRQCWAAAKQHLVREVGALLLSPAYDVPTETIGYITRYAPGLRENGGVYSHAATWAIAAAAKMRDSETVGALLNAMNPANKDPERYWAEPYVLPGNVDGPESPLYGRAGWTWYTGSAQWLHRVIAESVLGVRPTFDGLRIDPCLPPAWNGARVVRPWMGCRYEIEIVRGGAAGAVSVELDGKPLPTAIVPMPKQAGAVHRVRVVCS